METTETYLSSNSAASYSKVQRSLALITYGILCFRGCLGWIGIDTILLTLLLNVGIVFSIDYTKVGKSFLLVPFMCMCLLVNKQILSVIDLIAMCLILKDRPIRKLAGIYFIILIIFALGWLLLYSQGLLHSDRFFDPKKGEIFSYGFTNPNGLGIFGFHIVASLFILLSPKRLWLSLIVTIVVNEVFYSISFSRTAWGGGIVLALCTFVLIFHGYRSWMKYPLAILPAIITIVIIYISKNVDSFIELDYLVSGRFSIYSSILNSMRPINWIVGIPLPPGPMDGSYIMLLFIGGIFVVSFFIYKNFILMMYSFHKILYFLPFIVSILACGVMENTFSSCGGLSILFWYFLINKS